MVFLVFNVAVLVFTLREKPVESFIGMGILGVGIVIYLFDKAEPE